MRTLHKKVLPQVRVLIAKCKEKSGSHTLIDFRQHRLSIESQPLLENASFDFYRVGDMEEVMFGIAVSKENADIIIPYKFHHDIDEKWYKYLNFHSDGQITAKDEIERAEQIILCMHIETFFQYANLYHKIL